MLIATDYCWAPKIVLIIMLKINLLSLSLLILSVVGHLEIIVKRFLGYY
ncbi:unnamed protein product [Urochloa humidicola]